MDLKMTPERRAFLEKNLDRFWAAFVEGDPDLQDSSCGCCDAKRDLLAEMDRRFEVKRLDGEVWVETRDPDGDALVVRLFKRDRGATFSVWSRQNEVLGITLVEERQLRTLVLEAQQVLDPPPPELDEEQRQHLLVDLRRGDVVVALQDLDPEGADVKRGWYGVVFEEAQYHEPGTGPMVCWLKQEVFDRGFSLSSPHEGVRRCNVYGGQVEKVGRR